eukprot:scaffold21807_cov107-Amphora_coffeaeformis.AAC.1
MLLRWITDTRRISRHAMLTKPAHDMIGAEDGTPEIETPEMVVVVVVTAVAALVVAEILVVDQEVVDLVVAETQAA